MSRYYKIVIGPETSPRLNQEPASNNPGITFTNQVNGQANLNAQQIEFDISVTKLDGQSGVTAGSKLTIRGVSILQIAQASDFNNAPISVSAGMQNGLPLATAAFADSQQGELVSGIIREAYGNWIGTEQSLEFIIMPSDLPTQGNPGNFFFIWKKGQTMESLIRNAIGAALPTYTIDIHISDKLIAPTDIPGQYGTLSQLASWVQQQSLSMLKASDVNYNGVQISVTGSKVTVTDNQTVTPVNSIVKQLNAQDFIGQPTWLGPFTIQFNTVLRADLSTGSFIKFPTALSLQTQTNPQSLAFARQKTTFAGTWQILFIRHLGNSRGANATDWISTFTAVNPTQQQSKNVSTADLST